MFISCPPLLCIIIEKSGFIPTFSMKYGENSCWISDRMASFIFFCLPMAFVCLTNIVLYGLTVSSINYVSSVCRAERILQTHTLIGQYVQLPSSDWTRATELYLLSDRVCVCNNRSPLICMWTWETW